MFDSGLQTLKTIQEAKAAKLKALQEVFVPLRSRFLDTLRAYSEAALQAGLEGYEPLAYKANTAAYLECSLLLNSIPVVIISSDVVRPTLTPEAGQGYGPLTARILIYLEVADPASLPYIEIDIQETRTGYKAVVSQRPHEIGKEAYSDQWPIRSVSSSDGRAIAEHVIEYIGGLEYLWPEHPALGQARNRAHGEIRPFSFARHVR